MWPKSHRNYSNLLGSFDFNPYYAAELAEKTSPTLGFESSCTDTGTIAGIVIFKKVNSFPAVSGIIERSRQR
jgi:hypothetical protein